MRKPRNEILDGGWIGKQSFTATQLGWFSETPWCAVFALLVTVHHNCPELRLPEITSDDDLKVLREFWEQHVTFPTVFRQNWPGLDSDTILLVLDQVYGLTCRTICEDFIKLDGIPEGISKETLSKFKDKQSLSMLACYQEFWKTNAVGIIITEDCNTAEYHAIAFTTRGTSVA